jgi:hypothetical protein
VPDAITGDMHSVNKANFAILHWFGGRFAPRFTDLDEQLSELYCAEDAGLYQDFLVRPAGQIDVQAILDEQANIDRIVATLGQKEMTQGTLIRKLCTYSDANPTRRAIFDYDMLVRSIYTLRYLRDPQLQRNVHPLAEPHRVVSPAPIRDCAGRRQEGADRQDRSQDRDQQPVRAADRQRHHLLQLGDPVAPAGKAGDQWQREGAGAG